MDTEQPQREEAAPDPLGALKLPSDVLMAPVPPRGLMRQGLACAVALHVGLVAILWTADSIEGFGPSDDSGTIGVEVLLADPASEEATSGPTQDSAQPFAAAMPTVTEAPREVRSAPEPLPETPEPVIAAVEPPETTPEPPQPEVPALSTADLLALAKERESTASQPSEEARPSAPPLSSDNAGTGQASAYQRSVYETLSRRPPRVPPGQTGRVEIAFTIGQDGSVATARIKQSSGSATLDDAALQAVRGAKFPTPPATATRAELDYAMPYTFR